MSRVLIVSNRLPVTLRNPPRSSAGAAHELERSVGGLATGLKGVHDSTEGLWIGWPGPMEGFDSQRRAEIGRELERLRLVGVDLEPEVAQGFYEGHSTGVLWPLFHSLVESLPLSTSDFVHYARANERFAEVVAEHWREGDLVWVHDYHLFLLPALLRRRLPRARIGFFLHIPFPASPLMRTLPHREELLRGLLGADLIGFHTHSYVRHFAASILRILGAEVAVDRVSWEGREVHVGTFPMGVDAPGFSALAEERQVLAEARRMRRGAGALLVGIDRLDYTKGIPRRLLALEQLLRSHPDLRGRVRLIQVAVPSRTGVQVYRKARETIDALVGRIHGAFATPSWVPLHYIHRRLSPREVTALYRAADVMLVTPIRDGMNLVAKEFVAARNDEGGVLVLSEFAGASSELSEALLVNPFDVDAAAQTYASALAMPRHERRARMRAMRERVFAHDLRYWSRTFLGHLAALPAGPRLPSREPADLESELLRSLEAGRRLLLLDYDGTLVPFEARPEDATPDEELLALLGELCGLPETRVELLSGRAPGELERWFGHLPLGLHGEHGLWSRCSPGSPWTLGSAPALPSREAIGALLDDFAERTPGARVERKTLGFAWHWRLCDPEYGARQAHELRLLLAALCCNQPIEVIAGERVIEVRPSGANKGVLAARLLAEEPPGSVAVALGDDRTDEDLFQALPAGSLSIHVGSGPSRARLAIPDWRAARSLLQRMCARPSLT